MTERGVWSKDSFLWRPISIVNRLLLPVGCSATNCDVKTEIPGAGSFLLGFREGGSWVRVNLPQTVMSKREFLGPEADVRNPQFSSGFHRTRQVGQG